MENVNRSQRTPSELGLGEVMNDLQRGLASASYLDTLIQDGAGSDAQVLVEEIKGCFSRAMTTLNSQRQADEYLNPLQLPYATSQNTASAIQSNPRRRNRPRVEGTSTSQEKVIIENPDDADCYAWTIFGQREIENSKYPRLYYECGYKDELNCCATKTVRRLEEHPSMYEIVYCGQHTCMPIPNEQDFQNSEINFN